MSGSTSSDLCVGGLTCPACGEPAADENARFCENCRAALRPETSPAKGAPGCHCANPDPDGDGYCQTCGMKLAEPIAAPEFEEQVDGTLAVASDIGRRHPTNQDFGAVARREDGAVLLVVADGVSTSDNAEAASRAAVEAARRTFFSAAESADGLAGEAKACVLAAAEAVIAVPVETPVYDGPASTIVTLLARFNLATQAFDYAVAWVGDSHTRG